MPCRQPDLPLPDGLAEAGRAPDGEGGTILLLAPDGPRFWEVLQAAPEGRDGAPDPVDRWSRRVIGGFAQAHGGAALFPFDDPPWPPFTDWALASGRAFASPVGMLVHDRMGLWFSLRGAVRLNQPCPPPPGDPAPCAPCPAPCRTACPVDALRGHVYDTAACHAWLDTPGGADCLALGCRARRACPAARPHASIAPGQAAHHMRIFHP